MMSEEGVVGLGPPLQAIYSDVTSVIGLLECQSLIGAGSVRSHIRHHNLGHESHN